MVPMRYTSEDRLQRPSERRSEPQSKRSPNSLRRIDCAPDSASAPADDTGRGRGTPDPGAWLRDRGYDLD